MWNIFKNWVRCRNLRSKSVQIGSASLVLSWMCDVCNSVSCEVGSTNCSKLQYRVSSLVKPPEWLGPLVICTPDLDGTCRSPSGEFSSFAHPCVNPNNRHPLVDGEVFSPSGYLALLVVEHLFGSTMIAWSLTIIRIIRQLLCDLGEGEPWWQLVKGDQCVLSPESRKVDSQHLRILSFGIIASRSISTWKRLFKCWNHCTESEFHESTIIIAVNFHYTILSKDFAWTLKAKLNN